MPCSPVHVPWSASARLGASEEVLSRVLLPPPHQPRDLLLPAQLFSKGLDPVELLGVLWVYHQDAVEIAIAHVSNNGT